MPDGATSVQQPIAIRINSQETVDQLPSSLNVHFASSPYITPNLNSTIPRSFCQPRSIVLDAQRRRFITNRSIPQLVLLAICTISEFNCLSALD
jgi:hypothetical protein